jgi:Fic family protein
MDRETPPIRFSDLPAKIEPLQPGTPAGDLLLGEYRPWRKIRPIARQVGMDPIDAWTRVKAARLFGLRAIELDQDRAGKFRVCLGTHILEALHRVDRATGGGGAAAFSEDHGIFGDESSRHRLRIKTLMDEAAESSIIEGAATTRRDAVEMLRSGREPGNQAERMVRNNYVAMQRVKAWPRRPLSPELLLELQEILTKDTLDRPDEAGRFRRPGESARVVDERTSETIFVPPPAEHLEARLARLCAFANAPHDSGPAFLHPIVKASILHFMIGYEHPFCDGNGRTARAVFYWFSLRHGYSIFEYMAISELIRKGFARYPQAYVDTETDDGDLTYFVLYKLDIIEQALDRLGEHIRAEEERIKRSQSLLKLAKDLNLRQRLLLEHGLRHPLTQYTVNSHMNSNGIAAATARADLDDLVRRRLMVTLKKRKQVLYLIAPTLERRLKKREAE